VDLKEIGEFGLIDLIKTDTIIHPESVVAGIGDDAAVLLPTPRQLLLLTTDMLVEDIHFDLRTTTSWQLGYKAVAVNLSDIAAMGGIPRHLLVSLAIPQEVTVEFITGLYEGMKEICHEFGVNIVGGDTVASPRGLIINVAVSGEVEPGKLQRRGGAVSGDVLVVTGNLGNSACGLDLLQLGDWEEYPFAWPLVTSHLTPRPLVKTGQMLAALGSSCMDDVSDGLASEANEIAAASRVGLRIYADKIPVSNELRAAAAIIGKKPLEYALYGGEDYQLLFSIAPDKLKLLTDTDLGVEITPIGEVIESGGVTLVGPDGGVNQLLPQGYNHFK
jgi:thiamine-monophosphate kinase